MNKERRKYLQTIIEGINELQEQLEVLRDEEREHFDNMSERIQLSARGRKIEWAAEYLSSAIDSIEEAVGHIEEAIKC